MNDEYKNENQHVETLSVPEDLWEDTEPPQNDMYPLQKDKPIAMLETR